MEQETDGPVVGGGALSGKARIRERSFSLKIVSLTLGRERKTLSATITYDSFCAAKFYKLYT